MIFEINTRIMRSVFACWVLLLLTSCGPGTFVGTWSDIMSKRGPGRTGQVEREREKAMPDAGTMVSRGDPSVMRLYAEEGRGLWLVNEQAGLAHTIIGIENGNSGLLTFRETGPQTGLAVAAGDLNGDGRDDLILGAPEADGPLQGATASGWVYVVFGREQFPKKLDLKEAGNLSLWAGRSAGRNRFGQTMITADLNGDGLSDVIIGAPHASPRLSRDHETTPGVKAHAGSVFVLYGRRDWGEGSQLSEILDLSQRADVIIHGAREGDLTGFALAAGDVNGDLRQDLLIGAPGGRGDGGGGRQAGLTYIIHGRSHFPHVLDLSNTWNSRLHGIDGSGTRLTLAQNRPDRAGSSLATGDVNGDGIDDVVIGAPFGDGWSNEREDAGECYVVFGHATLPRELTLGSQANVIIYGTEPFVHAGRVVTIGDLNHDGAGDVVIGSSGQSQQVEGAQQVKGHRAHVIHGGSGLSPELFLDRQDTLALLSSDSGASDSATASLDNVLPDAMPSRPGPIMIFDHNRDGHPDVLVGLPEARGLSAQSSRVSHTGQKPRASRPGVLNLFLSPGKQRRAMIRQVIQAPHPGEEEMFGASIAHGDFNGDGRSDLLVGAPGLERSARTLVPFGSLRPAGGGYLFFGRPRE